MVTDEDGRSVLVQGTMQRQEAADVLRAYTTWLGLWRDGLRRNAQRALGGTCTTS
jgi:hypothetical protein